MSGLRGPVPGARRTTVLVAAEWVRPDCDPDGPTLPLVVRPNRDGVDVAGWAQVHHRVLRSWIDHHGALLFRGFDVTQRHFADVLRALAGEPIPYGERSSPRTEVMDRVYTATDHPADQPIALHNENSYQFELPATLVFGCLEVPDSGGATTLADTRRVLDKMSPDVVDRFARHGVRYTRKFGGSLGLTWQEAFQTTSRNEVSAHCDDRGIEWEWLPDDVLRTRQTRPALARHPRTGERAWVNHAAFFHVSSLLPDVREALLLQFGEEELPSHATYGDGRPIETEVVDHVRDAYRSELVAVRWQRGDVLMVDNILVAHGREPFVGRRRIVVGMGGRVRWSDMSVTDQPRPPEAP